MHLSTNKKYHQKLKYSNYWLKIHDFHCDISMIGLLSQKDTTGSSSDTRWYRNRTYIERGYGSFGFRTGFN